MQVLDKPMIRRPLQPARMTRSDGLEAYSLQLTILNNFLMTTFVN